MRHNPTSEFTTYDFAAFMQRIKAAEAQPTVDLFGQPLVQGNRENTAREIVSRAARGERTVVNFVNAHCINTLYNDAGYRRALDASDRILPDGSGMSIASRMSGVKLGENLNGTVPQHGRRAVSRASTLPALGTAISMPSRRTT